MAVTVGNNRIHSGLKRVIVVPDNENTFENLVKIMDELNLTEKVDNIVNELNLK